MNTKHLPDDPAFLKRLLVEQDTTINTLSKENAKLAHQLEQLRRRLYGRSSEKVALPQTLFIHAGLPTEPDPEPAPAPAASATPARKKKGHGRKPLPQDLPRTVVEHTLPQQACVCGACGEGLQQFAWELSEQLEYIPASLHVIQHLRARYACPRCADTVTIASKPAQPIEKGLAGPGLLAHVLTSKYADHLPLHRQSKMLWRHGVAVSDRTLMDWVAQCATLLTPLVEAMRLDLLQSYALHSDDTPVPVRDKTRAQTRQGRLWVYVGDEAHPQIVFDYTPDRSRDGPLRFLDGWCGHLQADAYAGYDALYRQGATEVACWAHARRKFVEAQSSDNTRATIALAHIRGLYETERAARDEAESRGLDHTATCALRAEKRAEKARLTLQAFAEWLEQQAEQVLPKSPLGEAIGYARNQWTALCRYVDDGALAIDNNAAERALRRVAVGRKNWLFAGSDTGGQRAATVYSLIATCERHGVEPWAYLYDVLARLPEHSMHKLDELFPHNWTPPRTKA